MWIVNSLMLLWFVFAPATYQKAVDAGYQSYWCQGVCSTPMPSFTPTQVNHGVATKGQR
jgi:hypothetical protein